MSRPDRIAILRAALALLVVVAVGALVLGSRAEAQDAGAGRVDALFDTAKGIVPGQVVKIAGARVGKVIEVELTPEYTARLQLEIEPGFTPFRTDARCEIQPEGLISENFVQCDPGSVGKPELVGRDGEAPTVALGRTSVPVNLTDLFEIWEAPVRDRLRLLINSLGAGVAGKGDEFNEVLRRANPTLGLVREATGILDEQREELQDTLVQAQQVTRELSQRPERLQAFVQEGADVLTTTAGRRAELREGLRQLPPTLAATRPALDSLERFALQGAPLSRRLVTAAPELDRLLATVPAAGKAALPAVRALGDTAVRGRRAVRSARPVITRLRAFAATARPTTAVLTRVLTDLRVRGFSESLLSFAYYAAAATSRYDAISHIFPANINVTECMTLATETQPGCDVNYTRTAPTAARGRARAAKPGTPATPSRSGPTPSDAPAPAPAEAPAAAPGPKSLLPGLPALPQPELPLPAPGGGPAAPLLDFLLGP